MSSRIVNVRHGSVVNVGPNSVKVTRYGFEDVKQRSVELYPSGGPARVWDSPQVARSWGFGLVAQMQYYQFRLPAIYRRGHTRVVDAELFRLGVTVNTGNLVESVTSLISNNFSIELPGLGVARLPLMEPARWEPGFFVQYDFGRAGGGWTANPHDVAETYEVGVVTYSMKVKLSGFVR